MTQGIHGQQRGVSCYIAKVILEHAMGQFRTTGWLGCYETGLLAFQNIVTHEGEGNTTEIRTTAKASYDNIGIFTRLLHLFLCLQSDNSLMQGNMAQHRAKRIFTVGGIHGQLDSL